MRTVYLENLLDTGSIIHTIEFEYNYRQVMSINAFIERMCTAVIKNKNYTAEEFNRICWDKRGKKGRDNLVESGCPEYVHKSVWEFYDHIGYDYKNSTSNKIVWK